MLNESDRLSANPTFKGVPGPLVLLILDGVGLYKGHAEGYDANAFDLAKTPNLDRLMKEAPVFLKLQAHGKAVGLPSDDDMGNSEVGHNAIGAGRVFDQGAKLVNAAIDSQALFNGRAWQEVVNGVRQNNATLHFLGLLSDGNVHSHIEQLFSLLRHLPNDGVKRVRLHPLADGRDVDPVTFHLYLERLEGVLGELRAAGIDARIASGGGRMAITMDRYEADWSMVERGWKTHVLGQGRCFADAQEAVAALRAEAPGIIDQDLPPFVIADENGRPLGPIVDGDGVIFFNFRGDRAIEISRAMTDEAFDKFPRGKKPNVLYAGMMEYDGDLHIPPRFLVDPPAISRTMSEYLAKAKVPQLAIAETQKFGHVTYFWNGNNSEKFSATDEAWIEIPSDRISFDQAPAMKAREVSARLIDELRGGRFKFLRANLANGDMVGHTGSLPAAITAMEVVDECVGMVEKAVAELGGTLVITADHGNCDQMVEVDKKTGGLKRDKAGTPVLKTSHTLSPVPLILTGTAADGFLPNAAVAKPGLANIAATLLVLLGFAPPADYLPPLVLPKG